MALGRAAGMPVAFVAWLRTGRSIARAIRGSTAMRPSVGRSAESDLPGPFAHLDLAKLSCRELRDECRQQVIDESIDRGMVLEAPGRGPHLIEALATNGPRCDRVLPRSSNGSALAGHGLDLLAGRWLLAAASLRERHANGPSPRVEQVPEAIGKSGPLGLGDRGR
jgi:hypothetical protein